MAARGAGMGSVHAGFWSALFHGDPEGGTMFTRLVDVLNSSNTLADGSSRQRPIYLTGMLPLDHVGTQHDVAHDIRLPYDEPASSQRAPCSCSSTGPSPSSSARACINVQPAVLDGPRHAGLAHGAPSSPCCMSMLAA